MIRHTDTEKDVKKNHLHRTHSEFENTREWVTESKDAKEVGIVQDGGTCVTVCTTSRRYRINGKW